MPERPALCGDDVVFVGRASSEQTGQKLGGKTMEEDKPMLTDEQKQLTETVPDLFTSSVGQRGKAGGADAALTTLEPCPLRLVLVHDSSHCSRHHLTG